MKKIIVLIITMVLIFSSTIACATDFSSVSDEQLKTQLDAIRNELAIRGFKVENKKVILEQDGIQIYINGEIRVEKQYSWDQDYSLFIPVVIVNNSSHNISVLIENSSVNGWAADSGYPDLSTPAGKKAKKEFIISLGNTDVESIETFSDAEFSLTVYDTDKYSSVFETKPIVILAE